MLVFKLTTNQTKPIFLNYTITLLLIDVWERKRKSLHVANPAYLKSASNHFSVSGDVPYWDNQDTFTIGNWDFITKL